MAHEAGGTQRHLATTIAAQFPGSKACRLQFICGQFTLTEPSYTIYVGHLEKEGVWQEKFKRMQGALLPQACLLEVDIANSVINVRSSNDREIESQHAAHKWMETILKQIIPAIGVTTSKWIYITFPAVNIKTFIDDKFRGKKLSCLLSVDQNSLLLLSPDPGLVASANDEVDKKIPKVLWTSKTSRGHQVLICQGDMAESTCQLTVVPMCDDRTVWVDNAFKLILETNFLQTKVETYQKQIGTADNKPRDMTLLCNASAADQRDAIDVPPRIVITAVPGVRDPNFDDKYLEAVKDIMGKLTHSNATSLAIPLLRRHVSADRDEWTQNLLTSIQNLLDRREDPRPCTVMLFVPAVAKEVIQRWMDQLRDFQIEGWTARLLNATLSDKFLVCLFNAQSVHGGVQRRTKIHDAIVEECIDIMFVTETCLATGDATLDDLAPEGYLSKSFPCNTPNRGGGGGIVVIYKNRLEISTSITTLQFQHSTFDYVEVTLTNENLTFACIHRPVRNSPVIQLAKLFEFYSSHPGKPIILGDFNIHFDFDICCTNRQRKNQLQTVVNGINEGNFKQYVTDATRNDPNYILEWIVARQSDNVISEKDAAVMTDLKSDHYAVLCSINI